MKLLLNQNQIIDVTNKANLSKSNEKNSNQTIYQNQNYNQNILQSKVSNSNSAQSRGGEAYNLQKSSTLITERDKDTIKVELRNKKEAKDPSVTYVHYLLLNEMYESLIYVGDLNFALNCAEILYTRINLNDDDFGKDDIREVAGATVLVTSVDKDGYQTVAKEYVAGGGTLVVTLQVCWFVNISLNSNSSSLGKFFKVSALIWTIRILNNLNKYRITSIQCSLVIYLSIKNHTAYFQKHTPGSFRDGQYLV